MQPAKRGFRRFVARRAPFLLIPAALAGGFAAGHTWQRHVNERPLKASYVELDLSLQGVLHELPRTLVKQNKLSPSEGRTFSDLLSFLESRAGVTFDSANQRIVLYALHPKELVSKPTKSLSDARVQLSFLAKHFQSAFRAESASNAVDWISADQKMLDSLLLPELAKDFADAHLSLETSKLGPFAKRDSVIRYFVRVLREGKSFPLLGNNARALAFNFLLQHPGGDSLMYRILSERKPAPPRKPPAPRRYKPQKLPEHYRPGRV